MIGEKLEANNLRFLDAPVSGGDIGAKNGTLTIMVGGKKRIFRLVYPVFEPWAKLFAGVAKSATDKR
jgi:3-hydroxyisobutyrate dehydrogenase